MVDIFYTDRFSKQVEKLKKSPLLGKIGKQVEKIIESPEIGKPMRNERKGTREVYVKPYRLAYVFENNTLTFLAVYHKDEQ